jgi:uncharacterized protein YcbK (DUF882 family)
MRRQMITALLALTASGAAATAVEAASPSLRGSPAAMREQNQVAREHGLTFYRTSEQIHAAAERGDLVRLAGNENYEVADFVRHPFAHPAALLFVERLSAQYHEACGQKLVVTSAVRPADSQPRNSHALSVHPAGMALDLRVSDRALCRAWLEDALMNLERAGVLNGIRERHPPHYHVALYPEQYLAYAAERLAAEAVAAPAVEPEQQAVAGDVALEATVAPTMVAGDAGSSSLPGAPLVATLALLAALPLGLALQRGWIRPAPLGLRRPEDDRREQVDHPTR